MHAAEQPGVTNILVQEYSAACLYMTLSNKISKKC